MNPDKIESILGMPAVVSSEPMQQVLRLVKRVAQSGAAVLITGESGSGKELVARALHHYSLRCTKPWVDLNCGALPDHLMESELFGYEKGAFSGADSTKPGMFELANTGTLFLDEVGELDLKMQVKLLRVLDGAPYYRLGGVRKTSVDVRIVAATNQDLGEAIRQGKFRSDLFHRLSQVHIQVPPLRDRPEDIEALAEFFLRQNAPQMQFSSQAMDALVAHRWPGNVRELRNVVTKLAILTDGPEIELSDVPPEIRGYSELQEKQGGSLDRLEKEAIFRALNQTGGHQERAAQILGISRRTLIRKLKLYGVRHSVANYGQMAVC